MRILDLLFEYPESELAEARLKLIRTKDTQHLYLWHRLRFQNEEKSIQGALNSLILGILSEQKADETSLTTLETSTTRFLPSTANAEMLLNRAIENLEKCGYVRRDGDTIRVLPSGKAEAEKNRGQFTRLCEVFREQVKLDFEAEFHRFQAHEQHNLQTPLLIPSSIFSSREL